MSYENIHYETRGRVALITYDRQARRNAWDLAMYREVTAAVERANADDDIGAFVLTNAGPIFCAGIDAKAPIEPKDPVTGVRPAVATLGMADDTSWLHLLQRSKPSVVAVNGAAIGLGVTHILAADIRMGAQSSVFSFPFLGLSTMPEFGCTALLPRLVGFGRAMDILLTSAKLSAAEARDIGLITRIAPDTTLVDEAVALAETLAGLKPLQTRLTRGMLHDNAVEPDLNRLLTREREAFVTLFRATRSMSPTLPK
jgi:2-(1,2-epoxy-1,2-dihydrophenyl)acetyl-CoA isomerase